MATGADTRVVGLIRQASAARPTDESDQDMLRRFLDARDEAAFEALLRRHGPMVLSVCRSVLGNTPDADDAFQATFFVLVRRGAALGAARSLAAWLHQVAYRTALKARARRGKELAPPAGAAVAMCEPDQLAWSEVQAILHEELSRLAERYRQALVLCYLQGKTHAEAAALLDVSKGTVRRRLESGRALLGARLARRGVGPAAVLLTATVPAAAPAVPPALAASALKAASGSVPVQVRALADAVTRSLLGAKLKAAAVCLLSLVALTGAIAAGGEASPAAPAEPPRVANARARAEILQLPRFEPTAAPAPKKPREEKIFFWLGDKPVFLKPDGTELPSKDLIPAELLGKGTGHAKLSPTGTHVAFLRQGEREGDPYLLHVLELDGKRLTKIDDLHVNTYHWMGGDRLYAWGQPIDQRNDISDKYEHRVYELSTGKKRVLKLPDDFIVRAIGPDGRTALADEWKMTETKWHTHAHLLTLDGGKPTPLLELNQDVYYPTPQFSPDGKRLLCLITHFGKIEPAPQKGKWTFETSDFKFSNLFVVDLATKKKTVLKEYGEKPAAYLTGLAWAPDGKRIAYVEHSYEDEKYIQRVYVAEADGKNAREIYKGEGFRPVGFDWR